MNGMTRPLLFTVFTVAAGFALLRPSGVEETVVAAVCLSLLASLPSLMRTDLNRNWTGLALGCLLGLPIAAVFHYWMWMLPCLAAGWCFGLASQDKPVEVPTPRRLRFSVAFLLSFVLLFATILAARTHQHRVLNQVTENGIEYSQLHFGRPTDCRIVVQVDSYRFRFGNEETADSSDAVVSLRKRVDSLLDAGTSPTQISIVCEASNQRDRSRIWLLRSAFDNVRGRELQVSFRPPSSSAN